MLKDLLNSIELRLHLLRHFTEVPDRYREQLLGSGSTSRDIDEALKIPGSKFNSNFCSDPDNLMTKLDNDFDSAVSSEPSETIRILEYAYSENDYPDGIGRESVVAIDDLTDEERKGLFRRKREEGSADEVWHLCHDPVPTWDLTVVIEMSGDERSLLAVYPGKPAPPLPDKTVQDDNSYERSREFWKRHAFIIPGS